ncbi:hypothetical protein ACM16X_02275 [Haloarcula japonica]|uniref:hypothetical protein n=1 Tax=Haloarcula japonica TaxID=29282 RepID=UPI0039F70C98
MAATKSQIEIKFDKDFWLDVKVPANEIQRNWDGDYADRLSRFINTQTVVRKELEPYWRQFKPDSEDLPREKSEMLTSITNHEIEWAQNLYAIHHFGKNRSSQFIDHFFEEIESEAETADLEEYYTDYKQQSRRFGKLLMIDLLSRKKFRDIQVLDFVKGKMPNVNTVSENILDNPSDDLDIGTVLDQLGADSREYELWHEFEYKSDEYIAIKRHIRDLVELQVEQNQDVAEADLVILRFKGDRLMVYAPTETIAQRAVTGVNAAADEAEDELDEEIEFEPEGETAGADHFDDFPDRIEEIRDMDNSEVELTDIRLRQSPLAGSPKVEIRNEKSILPALDQLKAANLDLLEDPDNVRSLKINYDGRPYQVYLNRPELDGEKQWALRYSSSTPSEQEQEAFENFIESTLGITPTYRHS